MGDYRCLGFDFESIGSEVMKKLLIIAAVLLLVGCGGPSLAPDGSFGSEQFVGKFRDISIYAVMTPGGATLYIGVHEDGTPATTVNQKYYDNGSKSYKNRTVIIDGKEYIEKDTK